MEELYDPCTGLRKELCDAVRNILDMEPCLEKDGDYYSYEIYAGYGDMLEPQDIAEIITSDSMEDAFLECMDDIYDEFIDETRWDITQETITKLLKKGVSLTKDDMSRVEDFIFEYVVFDIPNRHYLEQEVDVDIFMDTGDSNYEFTLNCHVPAYGGTEGGLNEKSSLLWLMRTQGYDNDDLQKVIENGEPDYDTFMGSVYQELANETNYTNEVVFLVKMTVEQLMMLNAMHKKAKDEYGRVIYDPEERPECGSVTVSRDTAVGLFDMWDGGGSLFDIVLEKDVEIPVKYIYSALPDGEDTGWSVQSVYGADMWKATLIKISEK